MLAEDQAALLRALVRNGVEFVVVGGVAAQSKEAAGREKDRAALPQMRRDFEKSE